MKVEALKKRLDRNRRTTMITILIPEDVIEDVSNKFLFAHHLKICPDNFLTTSVNLAGVLCPSSLSPVAKTTGLEQ